MQKNGMKWFEDLNTRKKIEQRGICAFKTISLCFITAERLKTTQVDEWVRIQV